MTKLHLSWQPFVIWLSCTTILWFIRVRGKHQTTVFLTISSLRELVSGERLLKKLRILPSNVAALIALWGREERCASQKVNRADRERAGDEMGCSLCWVVLISLWDLQLLLWVCKAAQYTADVTGSPVRMSRLHPHNPHPFQRAPPRHKKRGLFAQWAQHTIHNMDMVLWHSCPSLLMSKRGYLFSRQPLSKIYRSIILPHLSIR